MVVLSSYQYSLQRKGPPDVQILGETENIDSKVHLHSVFIFNGLVRPSAPLIWSYYHHINTVSKGKDQQMCRFWGKLKTSIRRCLCILFLSSMDSSDLPHR